jgi:hypothetical protein
MVNTMVTGNRGTVSFIPPAPPRPEDDEGDVSRADSQGPVDEEQAQRKFLREPRPCCFDINHTGLNLYRSWPCPGIVGVVALRPRPDRMRRQSVQCLASCECDDGHGPVCGVLGRELGAVREQARMGP